VQNIVKKPLSRDYTGLDIYNLCNPGIKKTGMDFFSKHREQNAKDGCLRGSLSGKGQTFLTALIPAPGGDQ